MNYFDAPAMLNGGAARVWDGAMGGYNNPVLAGVVEAMTNQDLDRARVRVLSLGTGSVVLPEGGTGRDGMILGRRDVNFHSYVAYAAG